MPRKLYRNPEAAPAPERPGAGAPERRSVHPDHKDEPSIQVEPEYLKAVERVKKAPPSVIVDMDAQKNERLERLRQTKRRVTEQRANVKEEMRRRREEPDVSPRELSELETAALGEELESALESATDRLIEAEDRLRANPTIENAKEVERIREEAQEIYLAKHEVKPEPVPVAKPKPIERREPRTAEQEEMARAYAGEVERERAQMRKRDALLGERNDLKKRMEEMGGVWGGEPYFVLNERLQEIEKDLVKMGYAVEAPRGKAPPEMAQAPEGPTPEDKIADARKAMQFIDDAEKEVAARQRKLQKELASHGLKTPGRIAEELNKIEEELRAEATGAKPTFWGRMKSIGRRLGGYEPSHAVKELLKKWVDLETEMNGYLRERADAQALLDAAEREAGRERPPRLRGAAGGRETQAGLRGGVAEISAGGTFEGFADTFLEMPEAMRGKKELKAAMAMRKIQEEIEVALADVEAYRDLSETALTGEQSSNFAKRIRALEAAGGGEAFHEALEDAEEALMRYVLRVKEKKEKFEQEAKAVTPDLVRPRSVIEMRPGEKGGAYVPGTPTRRGVRLSEMERTVQDRAVAERREAERAPERVNKEVEVYRSVKWRKNLIDKINADSEARRAMHGVYEAFKHRMLEKLANEEEVDFRTGSPDPALDYALNLYRKYARRPDGKGYVYDLKIRHAAHEELEDIERVLGKNWDRDGWAARAVRAVSRGKIELPTESTYEEFRAIEPEEEGEGAEVIPLPHVKRALSEAELEAIEEEEGEPEIEVSELSPEERREVVRASRAEEKEERRKRRYYEDVQVRRATPEERAEIKAAEEEELVGDFRPAAEVLKKEAARMEETEFGYHGAGTAEFERGVRRSGRMKEAPKEEQKKVYAPLTKQEIAYLKESLNRRVLVLGDAWETVGPEVKRLLPAKHGWMEEYALLYRQYREGKARQSIRRVLERVNALLGIEKPLDLIIPPSPELREAVSREAERVERAFERAKPKVKASAAGPAPKPGGILTMSELNAAIARRKGEPTSIPPALEETPATNVVDLAKERKKRKGKKK